MSDKTTVLIYSGEIELTDIKIEIVEVGNGALVTVLLMSLFEDNEVPDVVFARTEFFGNKHNVIDALPALVEDVLVLFEGLVGAQGGKLTRPVVEVGD